LFFICCFIVLLSVVLHGGSLMFLRGNEPTAASPQAAVISTAASVPTELSPTSLENDSTQTVLITIPDMRQIQQSGALILVLDVRAERNLANNDLRAQGALRIPPDGAVERLTELDVPRHTWLFAFCA
jgi:hypothetical protein